MLGLMSGSPHLSLLKWKVYFNSFGFLISIADSHTMIFLKMILLLSLNLKELSTLLNTSEVYLARNHSQIYLLFL